MRENFFQSPKPKEEESAGQKNARRIIEDLEAPLGKILEELRPKIEKGTYPIILGEDASGRVPTLILSEVIGDIYEAQGRKKPLVRFVAGASALSDRGRNIILKKEALRNHMERIVSDAGLTGPENLWEQLKLVFTAPDHKVLIVTDTVDSGKSVTFLLEALKEHGIAADIAAVADLTGKRGGKVNAPLYGGQTENTDIYQESSLSGVHKFSKDLFAKPLQSFNEEPRKRLQDNINFARKVGREVASRLTKNYLKPESN